jgi:predicted O-methyltransferase YrrM
MEHYYHKIQGWFIYMSLYDSVVNMFNDGSHFVEVGSWRGRSTTYLAVNIVNSGKKIRLDAIDTWRGSVDEEVHQKDPSVINDTLYDEFLKNIEPVKHIVTPIRMVSQEAVKLYDDESLDFVMIDAGHDYESVRADIEAYMKKVRKGGMIAGDDHSHYFPGVQRAVSELVPNAHVFEQTGTWIYIKE